MADLIAASNDRPSVAFCRKCDILRDGPGEAPGTVSVPTDVIEGMPTGEDAPHGGLVRVEDQALIPFETAKAALVQAQSMDDVRSIRDKAEAARVYTKQARLSLEMQNQCAELKLRAERRAGEWWREIPNAVGSRNGQSLAATAELPLADLGLFDSAVSA